MKKWKVLKSKVLLSNKYIRIVDQKLQMNNGKIADHYYLIEKNDVALVLAFDRDENIILVNEYKHGAGEAILQCPIGFIEKGEKPEKAALRELLEETGYSAKKAELIGKFISSPSDNTNKIHVFLVLDAIKTRKQKLDDTEEIEVVIMPFDSAVKSVMTGKIKAMPHMAAILLLNELNSKN